MAKKLTIDDLGVMVKHGFDDAHQEMNNRFDTVDQRLESIELKVSNVAYRFELKELEGKVTFLEKEVAQLKAKIK